MRKYILSTVFFSLCLNFLFTMACAQNNGSDTFPFPILTQTIDDNPSPGNMFTVLTYNNEKFLCMTDRHGNPLFLRKVKVRGDNFQPHGPDRLSYYDTYVGGFLLMDAYFDVIDTFYMHDYTPDMHEFLLMENGDRWMMSYYSETVDMSEIVEGGDPNATVRGLVIQQLDQHDNVLFQWNGRDHFEITDSHITMTFSILDYIHANSINVDSDTSIIISSRNLDEVTKINTNTGDIIWRMGGANNQFEFINDPVGFSGQHTVRKQQNGNLTMYDNGINNELGYSRGLEYELDEENLTVSLLTEFIHVPSVFAGIMGNFQRLPGDNTFIYWGHDKADGLSRISEFSSNGDQVYDAIFNEDVPASYRVYISEWEQLYFQLDKDSLSFTLDQIGLVETKQIELENISDRTVQVNRLISNDTLFRVEDDLPIELLPGGKHTFDISFFTDKAGFYEDFLNFSFQTDTTIISIPLYVSGTSDIGNYLNDDELEQINVYPNPFSNFLTITGNSTIKRIELFNLNGELLLDENPGTYERNLLTGIIDSGAYIIVISTDRKKFRRLLVKQ